MSYKPYYFNIYKGRQGIPLSKLVGQFTRAQANHTDTTRRDRFRKRHPRLYIIKVTLK